MQKFKAGWIYFPLVVILGLAAWTRWQYIQAEAFQIDEFISMLAMRMILETGQPRLPSGLFYDHGLVFSYLGAVTAALADGDLLAARWWSLLMGVAGVALIYGLARRLFAAPGWALLAAFGLAINYNAIEWGGRARMYSQASFLLLLAIALLWVGTVDGRRRWARVGFLVVLWLAVNTHLVLLLALPPLLIALAMVAVFSKGLHATWHSLRQVHPAELFFALLVLASVVWSAQSSFVAGYTVDTAAATTAVERSAAGAVLAVGLVPERWQGMAAYLQNDRLWPFVLLAIIGGLAAGVAWFRRRNQPGDTAALFITLVLIGVMLELLLFVADQWQQDRYRFLLILPLMLLLAAYGLQSAAQATTRLAQHLAPNQPTVHHAALVLVVVALAIWPMQNPWRDMLQAAEGVTDTPNRYQAAFDYIDLQRAAADQVMAIHTPAAYLYADSVDYYVNHTSPVIIPSETNVVDGYTGRPYLANLAALNQALDAPGRLWFVVDQSRLYSRLEPIFAHELLAQMALVHEVDNLQVYRELDARRLPRVTALKTPARFQSRAELLGYALAPKPQPGQTSDLTTVWRNAPFIYEFKVFVQLRDQAGAIVANADFAPFDQLEPPLRERLIAEGSNEQISLRSSLALPPDLAAGTYTFYVGIYHRDTFERIAVIDDLSGENAIQMGQITVN